MPPVVFALAADVSHPAPIGTVGHDRDDDRGQVGGIAEGGGVALADEDDLIHRYES